ncbi:protein low psii accumulation 3 [Quercus suber]|uniref:Protein low psii accumulation 3 n=1 Tax=Quercus suber TaxID=58331 RepID=A0AAW0K0L6_QUESU
MEREKIREETRRRKKQLNDFTYPLQIISMLGESIGSSDEFIDAIIQLALAVVKKLQERKETRACIVFPDKPEKRRASQLFKAALDSIDAITIGSLDDIPGGPVTLLAFHLASLTNAGRWQSNEPPSLYIFINCSTRELATIEKQNLLNQLLRFYSVWNLTHCGALFVMRVFQLEYDLHLSDFSTSDSFSSSLQFIPVFYIESESTQKYTVAVAPYIVNYNGPLFRQYPDQRRTVESAGTQEEEGSSLEFLRRGYKNEILDKSI